MDVHTPIHNLLHVTFHNPIHSSLRTLFTPPFTGGEDSEGESESEEGDAVEGAFSDREDDFERNHNFRWR